MEMGTGSFARMKAAMNSHVAHERHTMFQASANNVRNRLLDLVKHVDDLMSDKTNEVFIQMRRDYRSIVGGANVPQDGEMLSKDQRLARKAVMSVIQGIEVVFMKVAGLSVKDDGEDNKDEKSALSDDDEDEDERKPFRSPTSRFGRAASVDKVKVDTASNDDFEADHKLDSDLKAASQSEASDFD